MSAGRGTAVWQPQEPWHSSWDLPVPWGAAMSQSHVHHFPEVMPAAMRPTAGRALSGRDSWGHMVTQQPVVQHSVPGAGPELALSRGACTCRAVGLRSPLLRASTAGHLPGLTQHPLCPDTSGPIGAAGVRWPYGRSSLPCSLDPVLGPTGN